MTAKPLEYNPIMEYWKEINKDEISKNRVSNKVHKVYKELIRMMKDSNSEWEYDASKANHAISFIESYCRHSKGSLWRQTLHIRALAKGSSSCYLRDGP